MGKVLKWVGIILVGLFVLGKIIDTNKTPEQKAEEAAKDAKRSAERAAERAVEAEREKLEAPQRAIPKCDSRQAKNTLIQAFDQSQVARTLNLSAVEVSALQEKSFDAPRKTRSCSGIIAMNNAENVTVAYKMEGREDGDIMLTFELKE